MRILLSPESPVPLYEQIKAQVRAAVYGGELAAGDALPSLRVLAADLRVSVMTVTRAYNDLAAEGLVASEHGRGFIVRPVDVQRARHAMTERVDAAVRELADAARAARMTCDDVTELLEDEWRTR